MSHFSVVGALEGQVYCHSEVKLSLEEAGWLPWK